MNPQNPAPSTDAKPKQRLSSGKIMLALGMAACVLLPLAVYAPGLRAPFLFDDTFNILENADIKNMGVMLDKILHGPWDSPRERAQLARPVTFLSLAANYALGGLNAYGYHLFNLALHILTTVLIFMLSLRAFSYILDDNPPNPPHPLETPQRPGKIKRAHAQPVGPGILERFFSDHEALQCAMALMVALLFSLHPIHSEVVLYTSNRSDSLATLFYLLSLLLFLKSLEESFFFYILCLASFLLAFLSKQIAATLPLAVGLFDFFFLSGMDWRKTAERWKLHLPLWLMLFALYGFQAFYSSQTGVWLEHALMRWTRWTYFISQPYAVLGYLLRLALPFSFSIDHDIRPPQSLFDQDIFFSWIFLGIIVGIIYWVFRASGLSRRAILFGSGWFFITLLPTSSIIPINDAMVERRAYLPGWGFFLGCALFYAWAFNLIQPRSEMLSPKERAAKRPQYGAFLWAAGLHLSVLFIVTFWRANLYSHPESLWAESIRQYPMNARAHYNLGRRYQDVKQYEAAAEAYKKALEINPNYTEAYNNLAMMYTLTKDTDKAEEIYRQATDNNAPGSANLFYNRGILEYKQKEYAKAEASYKKALELDPKFFKAYNNLAVVYTHNKQYDKAVESCLKALELDPKYAVAHYNLGNVYSKMGKAQDALRELRIARQLMPGNPTIDGKIAEVEKQAK